MPTKIKITALTASLLSAALLAPQTARAADPCEVVLCMYGKATGGDGGGSCSSPEKAFFDIEVWKKGVFQPWKTADKREGFLSDCPTASPADISMIISKFGKVQL